MTLLHRRKYIRIQFITTTDEREHNYNSFLLAAPQYQEGTSTSTTFTVQQQQQQSTTATSGASVIASQPLSPIPSDISIPQEKQSTSTTPAPAAQVAYSITDGEESVICVHVLTACKI